MKTDRDREQDDRAIQYLAQSLTNHTPPSQVVPVIEELRDMAKTIGTAIVRSCPNTRERSLALTHLEETVMWAVKSLVLPD